MSNLASIQIIVDIQPIPGADSIEVASVLGWQVVVKKDEFRIGDKCIYVQIDTVVTDKPEYEFLRSKKFRIKTIKLRGQISQGLILPLSVLPSQVEPHVGADVSEALNIIKYEKPDNNPNNYDKPRVPKVWYKKLIYKFKYNYLYKTFPRLRKQSRSPFPTNLVSITDEERIQNIPQVLFDYINKPFYVSYKLDGSSITIIHNKSWGKSHYRICSRRFELHDKLNDWYQVFIKNNFDQEIQKLVKHFKTNDIIVQGEAIGKFNGNHHNLPNNQIRLFNIYVDGKRLPPKEFTNTCLSWNIPCCPLYKVITLNHTMVEILKESELKDPINPHTDVEGLVWRSEDGNISFKAINNKYLLKHE